MTHPMLQRVTIINEKSEPRRLLTDLRQLRQAQLMYSREPGMTPAARMAIKATRAHATLDLAAAMANGDVEDVPGES
jgi:hypothetical protein